MNVVLCDDHRMFVEALSYVFTARGWSVVARAVSVSEAEEAVRRNPVDVCLLDLRFPHESGFDGLERLRATCPSTRVVILSALADRATVVRALASGASGFIAKTLPMEEIIEVVGRVNTGEVAVAGITDESDDGEPEEASPKALEYLTQREREVLNRLVAGRTPAALAQELGISYTTARSHVQRILMKLGVHSQLQAVLYVNSCGGMA